MSELEPSTRSCGPPRDAMSPQRHHAIAATGREPDPGRAKERPRLLLLLDGAASPSRFEILQQQYEIVTGTEEPQALDSAPEQAPDLIGPDLMIPDLIVLDATRSGAGAEERLHALRGHERLAGVPVLCVTDSAEAELRVRLLAAGAADCLSAPFLPQELQARVRSVLGAGRRHADAAQLTALVDGLLDGVFVADREGRFTAVNDAGCRLLGCSRAEILGKTALDFVATEQDAAAVRH